MPTYNYYKPVISPIARFVRARWRPLAHRGTGVHCPVCRRDFRSFLNRMGEHCPGCNSPARARFLWLYLQRNWPGLFRDPARLIQFAPLPGLDRAFRAQATLRYLSADIREPEAMVRLDLTHLDLPDACFDFVVCMHVLAHISNDRKAMREMLRILRPGGVAFVMTPVDDSLEATFEDPCIIDPRERLRVYDDFDYVRCYGPDVLDRLRGAGFEVEVVQAAEQFDGPTLQTHGLWDDRIYVCRRPDRDGTAPTAAAGAIPERARG